MLQNWYQNWRLRHQSRFSFTLHLIGIPLTIAAAAVAAYQLAAWRWDLWWRPVLLLVAGYLPQFIGHWHEGNDAGEVVLIKRMLGRPYIAISPRYANADGEGASPACTSVDRRASR